MKGPRTGDTQLEDQDSLREVTVSNTSDVLETWDIAVSNTCNELAMLVGDEKA